MDCSNGYTLITDPDACCLRPRPSILLSRFRLLRALWNKNELSSLSTTKRAKKDFRIGELNPGLVGTDHLAMIESDKS
jgi:hypothetical protein